jgi:hypothetical protein
MTAMGEDENTLGLKPRESDGRNPRLAKCFLCGQWALVSSLLAIDVEDGTGSWIGKKACQRCLNTILKEGF